MMNNTPPTHTDMTYAHPPTLETGKTNDYIGSPVQELLGCVERPLLKKPISKRFFEVLGWDFH